MKLSSIAVALSLALASTGAYAFTCGKHMKAIDEALAKNPKLSEAQMSDVKKYRADGEAAHKAGKHQDSLDTLAKAEKILGVKM